MTLGYNARTTEEQIVEDYTFDRYMYPEYYDCYNTEEIPSFIEYQNYDVSTTHEGNEAKESNPIEMTQPLDGPMDSPWPMCSHDVRHTGRSPYSTVDNFGVEKWRCLLKRPATGGVVIDDDGTLYVGGDGLYAIHSNGTLKWKFTTYFNIFVTPAIDEDGTIYAGIIYGDSYLFALYPSGTLKWKFNPGDHIFSSPAIGNDGTIYFGCYNGYFYALYSNGTLKWKYQTGNHILSSPAIGDDGTIYVGSHDHYLYAFHPENGTVKWKFLTGYYVRANPCIADDGTIYCVSRDSYLYALYPNGSMIWKTNVHAGTSPTIGQDGTIYAGWETLYAINPTNGSVKWTFDVGGELGAATPCNSIDGTIYFGNYDGNDIVAVNPDGTEKWRKTLFGDIVSAPAIGEDGTVYIGSKPLNKGYLHAYGNLDSDAPSAPNINGPDNGKIDNEYDYTFKSTSPIGRDVFYYIEWGDNTVEEWIGPYTSGQTVTLSHTWSNQGTYTIKARAKDTENLWGPWNEFEVTITKNRAVYSNTLLLRLLEQFPLIDRLLSLVRV